MGTYYSSGKPCFRVMFAIVYRSHDPYFDMRKASLILLFRSLVIVKTIDEGLFGSLEILLHNAVTALFTPLAHNTVVAYFLGPFLSFG